MGVTDCAVGLPKAGIAINTASVLVDVSLLILCSVQYAFTLICLAQDAGLGPRLSPLLPFMTCESSLTERCVSHTDAHRGRWEGRAVSSRHECCQHGLVKLNIGTKSDPERGIVGRGARQLGDSMGESCELLDEDRRI